MIFLKTEREISYMREAGRVVAEVIDELRRMMRPGITTVELDRAAEEVILSKGAKPAFKGLYGFPATICASVNEEVVHGIPGLRKLKDGDIISIDVGAEINGYYGDSAITLPVGKVDDRIAKLLEVTEASLYKGIEQALDGNWLFDISRAVQEYVESHGFSVVRDFVGHGIGKKMHEEPQVPNFVPRGKGIRLKKGMVLAIEPMVNAGTYEVLTLPDNWTVVTKDTSPSAHFEHTVAITDGKPEILTR